MATVDGRKIFRSDVDKYYDNNVASAQQAPTGEQATALRLNILHQMIDDEILMRRAEKLGLLATDEEVDRKYNEIKSPFTQEEFDKRLQGQEDHARGFQARHPPLHHRRQGDEQGSLVEDQRHRSGHHRLLQRAQGRVQPDRTAISPGADHGDSGAKSAGPQSERQSAERSRCAQEDPDDRESPRQRRRFRHAGDEVFRRPGDLRQWRRPRHRAGIWAQGDRSGHARRGHEAQAGPVQSNHHRGQSCEPAVDGIPHRETGVERTRRASGNWPIRACSRRSARNFTTAASSC